MIIGAGEKRLTLQHDNRFAVIFVGTLGLLDTYPGSQETQPGGPDRGPGTGTWTGAGQRGYGGAKLDNGHHQNFVSPFPVPKVCFSLLLALHRCNKQ